jgi:hypothetical protein
MRLYGTSGVNLVTVVSKIIYEVRWSKRSNTMIHCGLL